LCLRFFPCADTDEGADLMPVAEFFLSLLKDVALSTALSGPITSSNEHQVSVAVAYAAKVGAHSSHAIGVCS